VTTKRRSEFEAVEKKRKVVKVHTGTSFFSTHFQPCMQPDRRPIISMKIVL